LRYESPGFVNGPRGFAMARRFSGRHVAVRLAGRSRRYPWPQRRAAVVRYPRRPTPPPRCPTARVPTDPVGSFPHIPYYAIGCTLQDIQARSAGRIADAGHRQVGARAATCTAW
jgi:hypothetical protein